MTTADVVVVGGGVMGASAALHLARRRAGRVVLYDKHHLASGPTGRSSALLRRHYSIEVYARMAARAFEAYEAFEELTGRPAEITRCGLVMAVGPTDLPALQETVTMLRGLGVDTEILRSDDLPRLVPGLAADGLAGAAYEPTTGYGDPSGVTLAYAARARELGVEIREGIEVTAIQVVGGRVTGVRTSGGDVATPAVVNAAGPWGARLSQTAGIALPVTASRQQLAILRPPVTFDSRRPVFVDMVHRVYYRPETGGLLLVGARNPAGISHPVDPDAYAERIDSDRVAWTSEMAAQRFPGLADAEATGGYASLYDLTPDLHFVIDRSPQVDGLVHALGFSGHGFKHSPVVGAVVSELVCDGRASTVDVSPFSSQRFAQPPRLWSRYANWPF